MSDEKERVQQKMIQQLSQLVTDIKRQHKAAKKLHQTVNATIACPRCGGVIAYTIDGYRWHSRGACRSCSLNWRE